MISTAMPSSRHSVRSNSMIPARTETSSMDTGSSATNSSGFTTRLAAIATRCRWPPDSSCGNRSANRLGGFSSTRASASLTIWVRVCRLPMPWMRSGSSITWRTR
jgi:hypothetical protein